MSRVKCRRSRVKCQGSRVKCQGSRVKRRGFNFLLKITKLVYLYYKIGIFNKRAYNKSPASSLLVFNKRL